MKNEIGTKDRIGMMFSGTNISLFIIISAFLTYFYTDVIGLSPVKIGIVFLISKIFDGVSDLVFGKMVDKTRTPKGVCRPWIFRIAPLFGVAIIILFKVPPIGEMGQLVYLFIVYNLSQTVIYTISSLAVQSLPTYMTRDSKLQTELYVWNNVGVGIISLLISVFTMKIVTLLGGTQRA